MFHPLGCCGGYSGLTITSDRDLGYSCHDIISTMFKVTKTIPALSEHAKLEFIRVSPSFQLCLQKYH